MAILHMHTGRFDSWFPQIAFFLDIWLSIFMGLIKFSLGK